MRIVFFSTNAKRFDGTAFRIRTMPTRAQVWDAFCAQHKDDTIIVATQLPASFVADVERNAVAHPSARVQYVLLQEETPAAIAARLCALKPDLAIAATFWVTPFDWLPLQDAMVADELRAHGIETVCHPASVALDCYDKWRTHLLLSSHGFPVADAIHLDYQQFWCERSHHELTSNVYKTYLLRQLEQMTYPVVIKDTTGLSSYGMEVATTYKQALHYIYSGRTNSDRIIETYLDGAQFGTEIYGRDGNYTVLDPLLFSLNRYGITSPKQSVKLGPITSDTYQIAELKAMLTRLACALKLDGIAQVDVVFSGGKWFIIEVNPRLSGMTETYAASIGRSVYDLLYRTARKLPVAAPLQPVCNGKLPLLTDEQLALVSAEDGVRYVHQIFNTAAKQEREKGYCEVIFSAPTFSELHTVVEQFAARHAAFIEPVFLERVRALFQTSGLERAF